MADRMKPECESALRHLYEFLDGELTVERRTSIRVHLDECPPCLGAHDFELELRQVIARRCQDRVPDELRLRIAEVIEQERGAAEGSA
jgi:mycothiol system anti-sigma-R factor